MRQNNNNICLVRFLLYLTVCISINCWVMVNYIKLTAGPLVNTNQILVSGVSLQFLNKSLTNKMTQYYIKMTTKHFQNQYICDNSSQYTHIFE